MSNSASNPPFSDTTTSFTSSTPNQTNTNTNTNTNHLLHKLQILTKDNAILDKQLRQSKRDYGETTLDLADSRQQTSDLKSQFQILTSERDTLIRELRLEVKQLKHIRQETEIAFEEFRNKADAAAALEAENWVLRGVAEAAKAAEEKALGEKEEVVKENWKLKLAKESIIESATVRFKLIEKRLLALEASVANINLPFHSSQAQQSTVCLVCFALAFTHHHMVLKCVEVPRLELGNACLYPFQVSSIQAHSPFEALCHGPTSLDTLKQAAPRAPPVNNPVVGGSGFPIWLNLEPLVGQAAPVSIQETMDQAVVYVDSD
ncbi:hypothetical protein KSS87_004247 [Heliosperma pusillum]|nr:hypothetical protein KSS87_004247 [Heliosperma pusillum]